MPSGSFCKTQNNPFLDNNSRRDIILSNAADDEQYGRHGRHSPQPVKEM